MKERLVENRVRRNQSRNLIQRRLPLRKSSQFIGWYVVLKIFLPVILSLIVPTGNAIDVKWTPNENNGDGGGPLPLSNNQRQQLLQLEQTIMNSPDPQATLEKIASTNSMSAADLYNMLQRNHNDMAQSENVKGGSSPQQRTSTMITAVIWNAISTFVALVWQTLRYNPKITTLLGFFVFSTLYVSSIIVPQNGLVLNQQTARNFVTKGPTTVFYPPTSYIQQLLLGNPNEDKLFHMIQTKDIHKEDNDDCIVEPTSSPRDLWKCVDFGILDVDDVSEDGVGDTNSFVTTKTWFPSKKEKRSVQFVTSSQHTIDVIDLYKKLPKSVVNARILPKDDLGKDHDHHDADTIREQIVDWCIYHATSICQKQDITEFAGYTGTHQQLSAIKMVSNYDEEDGREANRGILIVPGLGDVQRYGIVPVFVDTNANNEDDDENLYLTLTLAQGAHFDGQIHVSIQPMFDQHVNTSPNLPTKFFVRASIVVPNKGKAPNNKIALRITSDIVHSIVQSIQIRVQQSMVRSRQSNSYSQQASKRAQDRRKNRSTLERQMEEMAMDRRRKWQRNNPSGTSNYRPSGERMRSPNSAVSFR